MKRLLPLLLLFPLTAQALDIIEMTQAQATLGKIIINITADSNGDEWVWYKFNIRFSAQSSPVNYCTAAKSLSSEKYGSTGDMSVLSFLQTYGPFPNTTSPRMRNDPWCIQ